MKTTQTSQDMASRGYAAAAAVAKRCEIAETVPEITLCAVKDANGEWDVVGLDKKPGSTPKRVAVNVGEELAHLIAAAPAMLEALLGLVAASENPDLHPDSPGAEEAIDKARAALALAEGG